MTANDLTKKFYKAFSERYEIVIPNCFFTPEIEMDILGIRKSGFIDEIEVKISVADFKKDFTKVVNVEGDLVQVSEHFSYHKREKRLKHELLEEKTYTANRFSFLIPKDLVDKVEIPCYAGLYTCDGRWVREVKSAPLLHKNKVTIEQKYNIARKLGYRFWNKEMSDG